MTDRLPHVLITGANSGLGYAVAQELATTGRHHVIVGARTAAKADAAIASMLDDPEYPVEDSALSPVTIDLTDDDSIARAVESVAERFGSLEILVNSAGVGTSGSELSLREEYRFVFETNVFGAAVLIDAFLPLLRASSYHDRRIVNVTSGGGQVGLALSDDENFNALALALPAYRSSKSALNMITAVHAMLEREEGITCLVAAPGPTRTRFSGGFGKAVHEGTKPIVRAATSGDPAEMNGTLVADESTEYGW